MMNLTTEGAVVWLEPNDDPKKKLKYGWRLVESNNQAICVDTTVANLVVREALEKRNFSIKLSEFKTRVKYSDNSRVDFLLSSPNQHTYLEVKSVTLVREKVLLSFLIQ